tara:strand:+ start:84151 stop:84555 length:405 start_codon:yes stop_codon:yes gene_type:complete
MKNFTFLLLISLFTFGCMNMEKVDSSRVFFANLKDGQTVKSPLKIQFGIEGMKVIPAGKLEKGTGHHHLIIDGKPVATGKVVPADKTHIHYGKGQTEDTVELSKGKHTLTLQFADGAHRSYGEKLRAVITVTVE